VNDGTSPAQIGIVGGGYAGMAAAVALARSGVRVAVYEAARSLGGRARSVVRDGHRLDNGQHILIGAYRETLALIDEVGRNADSLMRLPLAFAVWPEFVLRAARLPAPWHLAVGLLRAKGLSPAARLACIRFMAWARRARFRLPADTSVAELLRAHGQHASAIRYLWEPLCVAALNTPLATASAQVFLNVLRDGLASERSASDLILPRIDLGALFPEPAADYVRSRGGEVRLGVAITRIEGCAEGFMLHGAQHPVRHRGVIVATHPARVPGLLGRLAPLAPDLAPIAAMTYQPIVTIYLQYAASPRDCVPMLGLSGGAAQWLFDRGTIAGQHGMLAAVISARARQPLTSHAALARQVQDEIARVHPDLGAAQWCQVIEEKRATFACTPGMARVASSTRMPGLFLAGDYTEPGYPGTIEAAVRSGLRCAAASLETLALSRS
jgi:squalene-associated FAD-dependent desaturase